MLLTYIESTNYGIFIAVQYLLGSDMLPVRGGFHVVGEVKHKHTKQSPQLHYYHPPQVIIISSLHFFFVSSFCPPIIT